MKKYVSFFLLLFACSLCFGQQAAQADVDMEFTTGYSFYFRNDDFGRTINHGIPLGMSTIITIESEQIISVSSLTFILIPVTNFDDSNGKRTIYNGNGNFLYSFEAYSGFVFPLIKTEKLTMPLSIGLRINFNGFFYSDDVPLYGSSSRDVDYLSLAVGVAFNFGVNYSFNDTFYFTAKLHGAIDFLSMYSRINKFPGESWGFMSDKAGLITGFEIRPQIGIGMRIGG
ncbi:MAG: hypothetical protein FWD28_00575 [Treponema sp.]|nr:hypothetical protein [Treponema sp.]